MKTLSEYTKCEIWVRVVLALTLFTILQSEAVPAASQTENANTMRRDVQNTGSNQLYTRVFKVDPNTSLRNLRKVSDRTVSNAGEMQQLVRGVFAAYGVDTNPPKSLFYNDQNGMLLVRGTMADMDAVETTLQVLNYTPPQVNIKVKFVDMPEDVARSLNLNGRWSTSNNVALQWTGILTDPQYRTVLKTLENREGVSVLAKPEVTTLSGRQAQIQVIDIMTLVTGIKPEALIPPGITTTNDEIASVFQTEQFPVGPTIDLIPYVSPDGITIRLSASPKITEFLGYDNPANPTAVYVNGKKQMITPPLPRYRTNQIEASCTVWDGQTVVLGGMARDESTEVKDKVPVLSDLPLLGPLFRHQSTYHIKKNILVFVTPTIIDPAGNRVHTDEEMRKFDKNVPPQRR